MKGLSSFSSPSSCDRTTPGCICIPRILRRILCFISIPSTCPFDVVLNKEEEKLLDGSVVGSSGTTPGVVAKLMGLESLPLSDDPIKKPRALRARGRFVIPVTYQELEDDDYLIFSFESQHRKSAKKKRKKSKMRRNENCMVSRGGLLDGRVVCDTNDLQVEDGRVEKLSPTKIRKEEAKMIGFEMEGESENSSPNSVLEFVEFATDQQASNRSGNVPRLGKSKMRRTLSEELEKCESEKSLILMNKKKDEIGMKLNWAQDEMCIDHFKVKITRDVESLIIAHLLDEFITNLINHV